MEASTIALLVLVAIFIIVMMTIFIKAANEHAKLKEQALIRQAAYDYCKQGKHYVHYGISGGGDPFKETKYEYVILDIIDDWVKYKETDTQPNGKQTYSGVHSCRIHELYTILTSRQAKNTIYYETDKN